MLYDGMDLFRQSFSGGPSVDPVAARKQLEVWLLGYQAVEVRQLGGHYAVRVMPADGLQIIRFPDNGGSLEVHIVHDGVEIARLPNHPFADIY